MKLKNKNKKIQSKRKIKLHGKGQQRMVPTQITFQYNMTKAKHKNGSYDIMSKM